MDKKDHKQATQARNTRRIYNAVDKVGDFARKWWLPALTVVVAVAFNKKTKADRS